MTKRISTDKRRMKITMKRKAFMTIALLCALVQGTWAQTSTQVSSEDGLQAALNNGESVTLTSDITLTTTLLVKGNTSATIDLNGHTLSRGLGESATSAGSNGYGGGNDGVARSRQHHFWSEEDD